MNKNKRFMYDDQMYITYLYRKEVSCRNLHILFNLKIIMYIFTKLRSVTTPWVKIKLRNVIIVISKHFGYPNYHNECVLLPFQLRCSRVTLVVHHIKPLYQLKKHVSIIKILRKSSRNIDINSIYRVIFL